MALIYQTVGVDDGFKGTDEFGGCISFGNTTDAIDVTWQTQTFSVGFEFQLDSSPGTVNTCRAGWATALGATIRQYLSVTSDASNFTVLGILDTTACGFQTVAVATIPRDTGAHHVGWSYDAAGDYHLVVDGVEMDTGAAPCADISEPFSAADRFSAWSSTAPGDPNAFKVGQVFWSPGAATVAQLIDIQTSGLP